jgi:glycosyltransferase involved in cell wall biosynthesis
LKQFDGFLLLSVFEGLPNVLIESQFAGVPVVSTPAGGAAETVIQGQTGLILDDGEDVDPRLVADKLLILRSNHHQRPAVAALANDWVRRTFSVEQMLDSTARMYLR